MLETLSMADFAPHVDSTFRVALDAPANLELTLSEVQALTDLRRAPSGDAVEGSQAFSLLFHGPKTPILPQRIYPLEHPTMGHMEDLHRAAGAGRPGDALPGDLLLTPPRRPLPGEPLPGTACRPSPAELERGRWRSLLGKSGSWP